jgi:hypothetical protein
MTLSKMIWDALYIWFDYRSVYLGKYSKGSYTPIFSVRVFFAQSIETRLHKKYARKNCAVNDKATKIGIARSTEKRWKQIQQTGSGHTEWFNLTQHDIAQVKIELFLLSAKSWLRIVAGMIAFLFLAYCCAVGLVVLTDEYGLKLIQICSESFFQ